MHRLRLLQTMFIVSALGGSAYWMSQSYAEQTNSAEKDWKLITVKVKQEEKQVLFLSVAQMNRVEGTDLLVGCMELEKTPLGIQVRKAPPALTFKLIDVENNRRIIGEFNVQIEGTAVFKFRIPKEARNVQNLEVEVSH